MQKDIRQKQSTLLFFDTETTGVPKDYKAPSSAINNWPRLVQLSWIKTDNNGTVLSQGDYIIKPDGFVIPESAAAVHNITTAIALEKGQPLTEVLEKFKSEIASADLIIGHNISFDMKVVGAELIRTGGKDILEKKKYFCTMKSTINFCAIRGPYGYKYPKLEELYTKLFRHKFDDAHNSNADVMATKECYFELKKRNIIK